MDEPCRLCFSGGPLVTSVLDESHNMQLKIMTCLPIKIFDNDVLPKLICDECHKKVEEFYHFHLTVLETEKRLIRIKNSTKSYKSIKLKVTNTSDTSNPIRKKKERCQLEKLTLPRSEMKFEIVESKNCLDVSDNTSNKISKTKKQSKTTIKEEFSDEKDISDVKTNCCKLESVCGTKKMLSDKFKIHLDEININEADVKMELNYKNKRESKKTKIVNTPSKKRCNDNRGTISKKTSVKKSKGGMLRDECSFQDVETAEDNSSNCDAFESLENEIEYDCCMCFFKCKGRLKILEHYRRHNKASSIYYNHPTKWTNENLTNVEIFECYICKSVFKNRKEFIAHYTMHRKNNGYRCSLCEKAFSTSIDILNHGLTHSSDEVKKKFEENDKRKTLKLDSLDNRFLCELCDAQFHFFKSAKDHRLFDHPENEDPFFVRCVLCKEKFSTYWMIRRHLRSHQEKLKSLCTICGKYLANNHKLNMHLRIHLGHKPFVCSVCSKSFVNSSRLKEHERVHSGERPYKCDCGKKFTQRSSLVIHMRSHSGDRPYACSLCQKGFISKALLTFHQKKTCI